MISGPGIEKAWRKLCNSSRNGHHPLNLRATEVFELAEHGDSLARKLLHSTAQVLATAISNISVLLNTSLVVFGGAVGNSEPLLRATRRLLDRNDFARPRLAISLLGEDAQLIGAVRLALDKVDVTILSK